MASLGVHGPLMMNDVREGYPGKAESARLFVALLLPTHVRSDIEAATAAMRRFDGLRWGSTDQIHITLRFIGKTAIGDVSAIGSALAAAVARVPSFCVELKGGGAFPSSTRPSVAWVGVLPTRRLIRLYESVQGGLARVGVQPDPRAFRPHVTVARVGRGPPPIGLGPAFDELTFNASFKAAAVSLMRSERTPQGARHFEVRSCSLGDETAQPSTPSK